MDLLKDVVPQIAKERFLHQTASAVAVFCRVHSEKSHPFSKNPPEDTKTVPLSEGDFFVLKGKGNVNGRTCLLQKLANCTKKPTNLFLKSFYFIWLST